MRVRMLLGSLVVSVIGAGVAGCNGGGGSGGSGGTAGGGGGGAGGVSGAGGSAGAPGPYLGTVQVFQQVISGDTGSTVVSFANATFGASGGTNPCTTTTIDANCQILVCPLVDGGVPTTAENAGTVTIGTPMLANNPIVMTAGANGVYAPKVLPMQIFQGGDPVSFDVSGSPAVPAVHGSVSAPSTIGVNAPNIDAGPTISRATPFSIDWDILDPPANGTVGLTISSPDGTSAVCHYDAAAGSATVPPSVLMHLNGGAGTLTLSAFNEQAVTAGTAGSVLFEVLTLGDGTKVDIQ